MRLYARKWRCLACNRIELWGKGSHVHQKEVVKMSEISYKVYQLNTTPKGEYSPPLEQQIESFKENFKRIYSVEPKEILIGPIWKGKHIFVRESLVYIPIPEQIPTHVEGYEFTTGYDTKYPELRT
jgi:hypothetical protein